MNDLGTAIMGEALLRFDDAALVRADLGTPRPDLYANALARGDLSELAYMSENKDQRMDILARWPWAKTVLVVVENYYRGDFEADSGGHKVSRYAWGRDYHHGMRRRLRKLRKAILRLREDATCSVFNDVDPILERAWAQAAGLGFIGKSNLFIHPRYGTWTFLGGLVFDLDTGADTPKEMPHRCGRCTRCLDACPTDAFSAPFALDSGKCLAMWNVEKPFDAAPDLPTHGWVAGCDICQEVCPHNRFAQPTERVFYTPKYKTLDEERVQQLTKADLAGTPLARPGIEGLLHTLKRPR